VNEITGCDNLTHNVSLLVISVPFVGAIGSMFYVLSYSAEC